MPHDLYGRNNRHPQGLQCAADLLMVSVCTQPCREDHDREQ